MKEIFEKSIHIVRKSIREDEFDLWLKDLELCSVKDKTVFLTTSSDFKAEIIKDRYIPQISQIFHEFSEVSTKFGFKIGIKKRENDITNSNDNHQTPEKKPEFFEKNSLALNHLKEENHLNSLKTPSEMKKLEYFSGLNPNLNFENFFEAKFNKVALGFSKKVTESLGKINPLYIYGKVGVGKTHLLNAIGNHYQKKYPSLKIKYFSSHEFVEEYSKALLEKKDRHFRQKYFIMDLLLFDDIQFFMGKKQSSIQLFQIFNHIHQYGKQMVFCSDRDPSDLGDLDDRLKSRLAGSHIVQVEEMKEKDKEIIFLKFLQQNNLTLNKTVKDFLIQQLPCDVRQIQAVANTLTSYQDIFGETLDVDFCKKYIKQLNLRQEKNKNLTADQILVALTNYSSVSVAELKSSKRSNKIAFNRQILMYLLREYAHLSLPEIGRFLGGKTPSAILYGISKIKKSIATDLNTQNNINHILTHI